MPDEARAAEVGEAQAGAPSAAGAPARVVPDDLLPRGRPPLGPPPRWVRLVAVVRRHAAVFSSTLLANSLPAFLEPLLFLVAVGIGLGTHLGDGIAGLPLGAYMGPGALAMTAMYTASFETTPTAPTCASSTSAPTTPCSRRRSRRPTPSWASSCGAG